MFVCIYVCVCVYVQVLRGSGKERALLRVHAASTKCVNGIQIATKTIDEGVNCVRYIAEMDMEERHHGRGGVDFIDVNCGCPIDEVAKRRGLGSALLRKPAKLERMLRGIVDGVEQMAMETGRTMPVITAKVRTSPAGDDKVNIDDIARAVENAGCAMLTIHGRTANARYSRAADWDTIQRIASSLSIPVVGNGDVLTLFDVQRRKREYPDVHALMSGRGALIKPWLFREVIQDKEWFPTAEERVEIFWTLAKYMKDHFGDDEIGKKRAMYFLPWHFNFFHRYRALPESKWAELGTAYPLIQSRIPDEEGPASLLERLLRCPSEDAHLAIAHALWDADDSNVAIEALERVADEKLHVWDESMKEKREEREMVMREEGRG